MPIKNATRTMPKKDRAFEKSLLRDKDVKFGFDNHELLYQIGLVVRQLAHEGEGAEFSDVETAKISEGPTLLALVRLAHAAGNRLVISLQGDESDSSTAQHVVTL